MEGIRGIVKGFGRAMEAVTFAEAGEFETARQIMKEAETERHETRPTRSNPTVRLTPTEASR